jgi:NAD(P)-dependent dehydrogenase (short-subunit alcohol dehydrogenase family)
MEGKINIALITAGSGGIGKAIVYKLLENNYNVAVTGRSISKLKTVFNDVSSDRILFIETNLSNLESMSKAVEETIKNFGQLDLLVNNAGGATLYQSCEFGTEESFDNSFNLNVKTSYFMSQYAIPFLIETKGCIINISSVLASRPAIGLGAYCASKAAVEMLTKTTALELASKGVRVLCVAPTATETEFHVNAGMSQEEATTYYKTCASTHPLGRAGLPNDTAEVVIFLAKSANFMTGSIIHVDGGRLLTSASAFKV